MPKLGSCFNVPINQKAMFGEGPLKGVKYQGGVEGTCLSPGGSMDNLNPTICTRRVSVKNSTIWQKGWKKQNLVS